MSTKQKIVDRLCEKFSVPKIPVRLRDKSVMHDTYAFFDNIDFSITYGEDCSDEVLIHEFCHYLIALLKSADAFEEEICDSFMLEFKKDGEIKTILKEAKKKERESEYV